MSYTIMLKRGLEANKPSGLRNGELYLALDTSIMWVGQGVGQPLKQFIAVPEAKDLGISATDVATDSTHRFVTDNEITAWNAKQAALGYVPENSDNKDQHNGYAGLDVNGKISSGQLPSIAITDTYVVAS